MANKRDIPIMLHCRTFLSIGVLNTDVHICLTVLRTPIEMNLKSLACAALSFLQLAGSNMMGISL